MDVIVLNVPQPIWLFPLLFSSGVLLQLAYFYRCRQWLFIVGICLVLAAAALDYDLALAVGQILAVIGIRLLRQGNKFQ
jgi:hypothetical protein